MIILWITGIVFIGTQIVLVWVAWRYADRPGRVADLLPRQPAARGHLDDHPGGDPGLHRPLPDGDLGRASSSASPQPKVQPLAEVTARQFQWVMRYPGPDGKLHTPDDLHTVNDLHFVKDTHGPDPPQVVATCSTRSSCPRCGSSRTPCPA